MELFTAEFTQTLPLLGMFIVCLFLSHFLLKPIKVLSESALKRTSPLDGLRGILALSVLVHHFYITYMWKTGIGWIPPSIDYLNNLGTMSVSFFFLITAFLFLSKINDNAKQQTTNNKQQTTNNKQQTTINWKILFKSRFKRILPMYFFIVMAITIITVNIIPTESYNKSQLFHFLQRWLLFQGTDLAGFHAGFIISHVQWTLIYEWGFYFSLPAIYVLWQQRKAPIILVITTIFIAYFCIHNTVSHMYWLFALALPSVVLKEPLKLFVEKHNKYLHPVMLLIFIYTFFYTKGYSAEQMICTASLFSFISNGYSFGGILNTMGLRKLGEISFSLYLSHGIFLYLFFSILNIYDFNTNNFSEYMHYFPFVFFISVASSLITYKLIERPFLAK